MAPAASVLPEGLELTWTGIVSAVAVLAALGVALSLSGRVFVQLARARARKLARSQARPGPPAEPDDVALAAAIAVALAMTEDEYGTRPTIRPSDNTSARTAWALYGRERLMNNRSPKAGR